SMIGLLSVFRLSLTSSQAQTRGRGVQLLSEVLQECYSSLSEREVEVLIAFYENRLKDHYAITPHVLRGLKALSSVLPPGSAVSMLKSLFQDVHVQSSPVLSTELKGLGPDFVFGFVQAVDGERDPRNLLLAFQIARNIIHRGYDLSQFTEELFEVTSCYFPIDFTPPPNDPHGITHEDLILALRGVLTGTPRFAEFLLPLIIEKLDSDVQNAKVDSLQTLAACSPVYGHKELAEFLPGLWSSIRREVFQTASERVESAGLAALGALTSSLSRSVLTSDSEDALQVFLELVLKDCKHHLCEPDLKLVWPSAKLLQAASGASYRSSLIVTAEVLPALLEQYSSRTQVTVWFMFVLSSLSEETVLLPFQKPLCSAVFSALAESSAGLQITATKVLTTLGQQPGERTPTLSSRCLANISFAYLNVIIGKTSNAKNILRISVINWYRLRYLLFFKNDSMYPGLPHAGSSSFSVEDVTSVCHSLQRIAEQARGSEDIGRFFHDVIIPRLLGMALQAALQSKSSVTCCFLLFCAVLLHFRLATQMAVQVVSLFLNGDVSFLPENAYPSQIQLLKVRCLALFLQSVCLLVWQVDIPDMDRLLGQLEELSCMCTHTFSYTSGAKCFAGLINKRAAGKRESYTPNDLGLEFHCLIFVRYVIDGALFHPAVPQEIMNELFERVAKALLLRYHPLSTVFTDKLFSLLSDAELGSQAADSFSLLMSDSSDVLNRGCHADVRIMYRQRFFAENSAKLIEGFTSAEKDKKSVYLKALSHMVNNLPRQVQLTELPALLPLLLEALSCPDQAVQLSTLSCLQPVLLDPPPALTTQLEALFSRLLSLTSSPSMKVRIAALRCVHALSRLPEHQVLPFRARVLRALAAPLDDKKRLVRKEAVSARGEWFLLGSPGGR
uniref:MMS19 nucleotide excision repair protein n=1 Tax=Pygocentrus nattereri TaxID=42514 RepID=A0AAR2LTI7_PYGNA